MSKDTIFIGQPLLSQMASFLDKRDVMRMSRSHGGERYVKSFDGWQHPTVVRILLTCYVNFMLSLNTLRNAGKPSYRTGAQDLRNQPLLLEGA